MKTDDSCWSHWHFEVDDTRFAIVSDGNIYSGPPGITHRPPQSMDVNAFLIARFLPTDRLELASNVLLMHRGDGLIMFDAGMGDWSDRPEWTSGAGRLIANMRQAGLSPESVDKIILTHCHADHIGGLISENGRNNFPNAEIHLSEIDYRHWIDAGATGAKWAFDHKVAVAALKSREDRLNFLPKDGRLADGINAIPTPGHTVGHTSFVIELGSQSLCVLGDVARHYILNLERPDWQFIGDVDPEMTVKTRRKLLSRIASDRMPVVSYHFPFGGPGHIVEENAAYRFLPAFT